MLNRPNLLFFENHLDPVVPRILNKLIPKLKVYGYNTFLDEVAPGSIMNFEGTMNNVIDMMTNLFEKQLQSLGVNENNIQLYFYKNAETLDIYVPNEEFLKFIIKNYTNSTQNILLFALGLSSISYNIIFLKTLLLNNIDYQGIDIIERQNHIGNPDDWMPLCNKTMAATHLATKQPIFSRNGLRHLQGLQTELIAQSSKEFIAKKHMFFYIYSGLGHSFAEKDNKDNAEDLLNLPLDVITIDATKNTDDQIVNQITKLIKKNIRGLNLFDKDIKTLDPNNKNSNHTRAQRNTV